MLCVYIRNLIAYKKKVCPDLGLLYDDYKRPSSHSCVCCRCVLHIYKLFKPVMKTKVFFLVCLIFNFLFIRVYCYMFIVDVFNNL